jgi:hypothetical protein
MPVLGRVIEEIVLHMAHAAKYPERCRSLLSNIIVGDQRRAWAHRRIVIVISWHCNCDCREITITHTMGTCTLGTRKSPESLIGEQGTSFFDISMSLYTIYHAEHALRQHNQIEKTLKRYSIAVLRELCVKRAIQVDLGVSRRLKRPYIDALLVYVR